MEYTDINQSDLDSGKVVKTTYKYRGDAIFFFKEGGQNMNKHGYPICKNLHRENDLPAYIVFNQFGYREEKWCVDGKLHRENDLPAVIDYENYKVVFEGWYKKDKCHRDNGPAWVQTIYKGQTIDYTMEAWYRDGIKHRDHPLPAEVWSKGFQLWFNNGEQYDPCIHSPTVGELESGKAVVGEFGTAWFNEAGVNVGKDGYPICENLRKEGGPMWIDKKGTHFYGSFAKV